MLVAWLIVDFHSNNHLLMRIRKA